MTGPAAPIKAPTVAPTDAALLARIAARDAGAMAEVYDRYAPRLYGLILALIRDRTSAGDVLQEVMVNLWQSAAARYDAALGSAESWLLMLARARAVDHLRRAGRHESRRAAGLADEALGRLPQPEATDRSAVADVARGLGRLPRDEQEPIMLAYAYGMSRDEIARQLDLPAGTVKTRISRGVNRLRDMLAGNEN
jgi:RNA polymerase sigma-70 factor, ECF subfamily